ncbi:hypothetical protein HDU76_013322 [Blyttiomyces sp. JEL0837]|nr:hypothetical protein HDU76_013322 [Blyttiomyces sp. JEL0837]
MKVVAAAIASAEWEAAVAVAESAKATRVAKGAIVGNGGEEHLLAAAVNAAFVEDAMEIEGSGVSSVTATTGKSVNNASPRNPPATQFRRPPSSTSSSSGVSSTSTTVSSSSTAVAPVTPSLTRHLGAAATCLALREGMIPAGATISVGPSEVDSGVVAPGVAAAANGLYSQRQVRYDDATAFVIVLRG